jgi:hypothetical protein
MPGVTLFTLVGIAGEDDIDAPDLKAPMAPAPAAAKPIMPNKHTRLNGCQANPGVGGSKVLSNPQKPMLGAEASATLRDQLVKELKEIASSDDAAIWAHQILGTKNSLTEADARAVEEAFQAKLATSASRPNSKEDRPIRAKFAKQTQSSRLTVNDFVQAIRGEPPQRSEKHWSDLGGGQAALPL